MKVIKWGLGVFGVVVAAGVLMFGAFGFGTANAAPGPDLKSGHDAALAAKLGITVDALKAAETAARNQLIDQAVTAGKLTPAQAAQLKNPTPRTPGTKPAPGTKPDFKALAGLRDIMANYQTVLAQKLNISVDALKAAEKAARDQMIDDAVKAGKLTQAQADRIKSGMDKMGGKGHGGPGGSKQGGPGNSKAPFMNGIRDAMAAAASTLKLTPEELQTQLRSGKSLAEIAQAKGIDKAALRSSILGAIQTDVAAAVRDGKLTAAQSTAIIERASKELDRLMDQKFGQNRGPGAQRGPGGQGAPGTQGAPGQMPNFNRGPRNN